MKVPVFKQVREEVEVSFPLILGYQGDDDYTTTWETRLYITERLYLQSITHYRFPREGFKWTYEAQTISVGELSQYLNENSYSPISRAAWAEYVKAIRNSIFEK